MRSLGPVVAITILLASGCCAYSLPPYAGNPTPRYKSGMFRNDQPLDQRGLSALLRWQLSRDQGPWREWVDAQPGPPPPRRVGGSRLRVTFINHATTLLQLDGVNILTDPIYSKRASPISWLGPRRRRPPGIRFEDLPPIDVVLVSHNHYDHLDLSTLRRLQKQHRPLLIVGLGNARYLRERGLSRLVELDWWQKSTIKGGLRVHAVPAQHFSARGICDRNQTLWVGFVIESEQSGNVYFAGDTGLGPHFRKIGERFAPLRLALLPIGAFRPRWFMKGVHLSPDDAVRAHVLLGAQRSVAMHFGTFPLGDDGEKEPVEALQRALKKRKPHAPFWVLPFGEGREVPP